MQHFTLSELTRSHTGRRLRIDNTPGIEECRNLGTLVSAVLDPLRSAWRRPITVTSGYRSPALNRAVGGAPTSHHTRGMAADITAGSPDDNRRLFLLAQSLNLPFTQLIDEKGYRWLHISHDPADIRRQILHL